MKKRIIFTIALALSLILSLALAISADSVHNENTVDYSATVTLESGVEVNLFDSEGNALIWYLDSNNTLQSIRADDQQVRWYTENWDEVTSVGITFNDGTKVSAGRFVVVNLMDDDIVKNHGPGEKHYGKHIRGFKVMFQGCEKLEYVYLRLDTTSIMRQSFNGCYELKFINIADLTMLTRVGDSQNFSNCKELLYGQVLDLSKTSLQRLDGGGTFYNVHFSKIIFPSTIYDISDWTFEQTSFESISWPMGVTVMNAAMFKNNKSLNTIYLSNKLSGINKDENLTIRANAFLGCDALEKVFYVGTLDELNTLLEHTSKTGNDPFWAVVGENNANVISYADYKKLSDKSGKYVVYDYSYCEAYNDGVHTPVTAINSCVGVCDTCGDTVVNHTEKENLSVKFEYTNYGMAGTKTTSCQNEGCSYVVVEEIPALVVFVGLSTPEKGGVGISLGFNVNTDAIEAYEKNTGKTIEFGAFAIAQKNLGAEGALNSSGEANQGAIKAEITQEAVKSFEFVITGFKTEAQKSAMLAMGAYVISTVGEEVSISYIQSKAPLDGDNYSFISFDEIN